MSSIYITITVYMKPLIKTALFFIGFLLSFSCERKVNSDKTNIQQNIAQADSAMNKIPVVLDLDQANRLSKLPLRCMDVEFPNKLNQTLSTAEDLKAPAVLHPAFYGCFDWHSAVHGHWSLVSLLKQFPDLENADIIRKKLAERISRENILKEIEYFKKPQNKSYERTYGWAWLLKLAEELHNWDDSLARQLETNLYPLIVYVVVHI